MWKYICSIAFVGLVVSQNLAITNSTTNEIASSNSSTASNASNPEQINKTESAALVSNNDEIKHKTTESSTVKQNAEADLGTRQNPFDPVDMATDENSLGNMKYYFALLVVSSLSVIAVIIFKTLRYVLSTKREF